MAASSRQCIYIYTVHEIKFQLFSVIIELQIDHSNAHVASRLADMEIFDLFKKGEILSLGTLCDSPFVFIIQWGHSLKKYEHLNQDAVVDTQFSDHVPLFMMGDFSHIIDS